MSYPPPQLSPALSYLAQPRFHLEDNKIIIMMEKDKFSGRSSGVRDISHRKMRSFELDGLSVCEQKENKTTLLLKNSKSTIDLLPHTPLGKSNRKTTTANLEDRGVRTRLFTAVYHHKISKLITSNTAQQRDRYMRKLNQALTDDSFRAVGYEFDHSYVRLLTEILTYAQVTVLVLDNNPLGDEGLTKLAPLLKKLPLRELSLVSVSMGNVGATVLFTTLREVPSLLKLNLSTGEPINKNKLTADGAEPLRLLLSLPSCVIDSLHLNHLQLGSEGARIAFEGVTNTTLESLSLSKNDIGARHAGVLLQSLSRVPLMRLDLSRNSLGDAGMKSLTDVLGVFYSKNSMSMNLSYLNIAANGITSQGFEYFCREMSGNRTLETLILDENPLGEGDRFFNIKYYLGKNWGLKRLSLINISPCEKDLRFICEGMESNRSLEQLVLSKNEVDCELLSLILFMLGKNKALRRLTLNNCKISDSYLLRNEYLVTNSFTAIEEIDLENNYINLKGAAILKKIVTANQNILKLSLAKNCMPETCIEDINEILKENESKRPFEHELNYFHSLSDLYQEKKKALKREVEDIRKHEEKLQTHLLAEQIEYDLTVEEKLKRRIAREEASIRNYEGRGEREEEEEDSEGGCFVTSNKR